MLSADLIASAGEISITSILLLGINFYFSQHLLGTETNQTQNLKEQNSKYMFVMLIVLQICLAWLQALGWVEVSSTGLLIHFGPDYLKQVLMVDHKKGDQKCMMSHRVLGQKKNIVTSAPISLVQSMSHG